MMMERSMWNVVGFSLMWCTMYFTLCLLKPQRSYEWHCRTVTAVHATVVCMLSAWCGFVQGPWPFTDVVGPSTPLQNVTIMVCLGYFLFDLSWCLYFQTEGPAMLAHHTLSVVGMTVAVITGRYGTEIIATMFGSEITNPLLQTRWFLRESGNYPSTIGVVVDILFMSFFGFFRIGIGSYLLYTYFCQDTNFIGRTGAVVIYGISWVFWVNIMQYAYKKLKGKVSKVPKTAGQKVLNRTHVNNNQNSSSEILTNDSSDHKLLANGSHSNISKHDALASEIPKNGYHVIKSGDLRDSDRSNLRQRIGSGLVEEKLLHSTVASGLVEEKLIHSTVASSQVQ